MSAPTIIARIWDNGWLAKDEVELFRVAADRELIEQYVKSSSFETSFLPEKQGTGIHGPFVANRISANDFISFEERDLENYLAELLYSPDWESTASVEQFASVLEKLRIPFAEGMQCFVLRFDESKVDLQHEWGFVFTVFREFLFIGNRSRLITRFIIGYD